MRQIKARNTPTTGERFRPFYQKVSYSTLGNRLTILWIVGLSVGIITTAIGVTFLPTGSFGNLLGFLAVCSMSLYLVCFVLWLVVRTYQDSKGGRIIFRGGMAKIIKTWRTFRKNRKHIPQKEHAKLGAKVGAVLGLLLGFLYIVSYRAYGTFIPPLSVFILWLIVMCIVSFVLGHIFRVSLLKKYNIKIE